MEPVAASNLVSLVDWIVRGGAVVALLLVIFVGYYEFWYYGPAVRRRETELRADKERAEKDRDFWRDMAVGLLQSNKAIAEAVESREKRR